MSDWPALEHQLQRSAHRRYGRRLRRPSRFAPAALVVVGLLALTILVVQRGTDHSPIPADERPATPSVAPAVGTWTPVIGGDRRGHPTIDRSPVDRSAVDALAVLRRPQTARDRKLAAPRLTSIGRPTNGVQVDGIRALTPNYALVPIMTVGGGTDRGPMLCVAGGGGMACNWVRDVAKWGVSSSSGGNKGSHYVGVVPDGVVRVRFSPVGGKPVDSEARENFYEIRVPQNGPTGPVRPPAGYKGPTDGNGMLPGPPSPPTAGSSGSTPAARWSALRAPNRRGRRAATARRA